MKGKFKISIIDFMLENGKHEVGKDKNGTTIYLGDMVEYQGSKNWFVVYRYGKYLIKEVGMMAMLGLSDWSKVERQDVFGAGTDWLIIGFTDEPFYETIKGLEIGISIDVA